MRFRRSGSVRCRIMAVALGLTLLGSGVADANGKVKHFRLDSQKEFLEGTLEGLAIDPLGTLSLADRAERVADLGEPFLLSAASHPKGWVVGTGNDGKVLLVERDGTVSTLFAAEEPEIFAVAVAADGTVLAGSSPNGKVYSIRGADSSAMFDPQQTYIWDLLPEKSGSVLVATGTDGKLFRVSKSGEGEELFDSEDTHLRTLEATGDGGVLIGTAGDGLILKMDADGSVRTLFDAAQPEVVDFALGAGGISYAAVLASEASLVDLSARPVPGQAASPSSGAAGQSSGQGGGQVQVTVSGTPSQPTPTGSRPPGYKGPRSEILRIRAGGSVDTLWSFDTDTVYALSWQQGRLWVGTGLEGKVFSLRDGRMILEKDLDERQVVALLADRRGPVYATTNAAALFRAAGEPERAGSFISPVLDAAQTSDFGTLSWVGTLPEGTRLSFSARSGMSGQADKTWSDWSEERSGEQVSLSALPPARFMQFRAKLESGNGASPGLSRVSVAYRQRNLPPRIKSLEVKAPGEVIVPPGFIPGNQTFEPSRPDKNGIFSTLASPKKERERQRKTLWKQGFRTLVWEAIDPNGDELRYALEFRPERQAEWLDLRDDIKEAFFGFDATVLPDGVYRFKLEAYDRHDSEIDAALRSEQISEPVYVDHSPPMLGSVTRNGKTLRIELTDAMSPLAEAEFSIDAQEWIPARVEDGLVDARVETVSLELPKSGEARLLLLRTVDAAFNAVTFDLSSELP